MNDLDPNELATTIIHQAHVIRRLEAGIADLAERVRALEREIVEAASQEGVADPGPRPTA